MPARTRAWDLKPGTGGARVCAYHLQVCRDRRTRKEDRHIFWHAPGPKVCEQSGVRSWTRLARCISTGYSYVRTKAIERISTSIFTPAIAIGNIINRPIRLRLAPSIVSVSGRMAELEQRARKLRAAAFAIHVVICCK